MSSRLITFIAILVIILVLLRVFNSTYYEGFENQSKSVVICKADWCGHCKKAAPEFQKLISASPITLKDGTKATVKILDADKDKSEIGKFNIRGFPTILIMDGAQQIEYPGNRDADSLIEFLNNM
jgi:thioredoxin-like negative regulator of GroEL